MSTENIVEEGVPPVRVCQQCGHDEDDHIEQDVELFGTTVRRFYCERCENWHDFVSAEEVQ